MVDIQSTASEIRRGKKEERRRRKIEITGQKYNGMACPLLWAAIIRHTNFNQTKRSIG